MARTPTPKQRIAKETHAVAAALSAAVSATVTMVRDPKSHRYQRHAARHAQRALMRARRVGPRRAVDDRRVRAQMRVAGAFLKASAHPYRHTARNRLLATGLVAAGVTGGVAVGAARSRATSNVESPDNG